METNWQAAVRRLSDPTMFVLAVVAILFAVIQFFDSRHQLTELNQVAQSMSTSYVGEFPKNMDSIVKLVGEATSKLDIMVDFPGYGHYSDPDRFKLYSRALQDAAGKLTVRLLIYSEKAAQETRLRQFRRDDFADKTKTELFQRFFKRINPNLGVPTSYDEFDNKLTQMQHYYESEFLRVGVNVRHTSERLQFYLWLEDNDDAVFSFQNSVREEHEIAFRTRDGKLIETFTGTFSDLWNRAEAPPLPPH
jgi:hypothetical protein